MRHGSPASQVACRQASVLHAEGTFQLASILFRRSLFMALHGVHHYHSGSLGQQIYILFQRILHVTSATACVHCSNLP